MAELSIEKLSKAYHSLCRDFFNPNNKAKVERKTANLDFLTNETMFSVAV